MSTPIDQGSSTRPYLLRALHDWCTDNGFTPYIAVHVDEHVQVPSEYVKNNEIVLNVGFEATSDLKLGNDFIEFRARFKSVTREIRVPVDHVLAIYARENGQGMAFPMPAAADMPPTAGVSEAAPAPRPKAAPAQGLRLARKEGVTANTPGPVPEGRTASETAASRQPPETEPPTPPEPGAPRPSLKRIK